LVALLSRQVLCAKFSQCYDDVNICLWTDGSNYLTQSAAQTACQRRGNSTLPRITNSNIQLKMEEFRSAAGDLLRGFSIWIDVRFVAIDDFHWLDGSPLAGMHMLMYITLRRGSVRLLQGRQRKSM